MKFVCPERRIKGILEQFGMSEAKTASTPLEPGNRLTRNEYL